MRSPTSSTASNLATGIVAVQLDTVYDPPLLGIIVASGDVNIEAMDGSTAVVAGANGYLPVFVRQVLSASTTATGIIGLRG